MERKQKRGGVPGVSDTTAIAAYGDGGDGTVQQPGSGRKSAGKQRMKYIQSFKKYVQI